MEFYQRHGKPSILTEASGDLDIKAVSGHKRAESMLIDSSTNKLKNVLNRPGHLSVMGGYTKSALPPGTTQSVFSSTSGFSKTQFRQERVKLNQEVLA